MPITVGPDPNNPGALIWVDAATGQPAVQPGGPGTPWVAPSDQSQNQSQSQDQSQAPGTQQPDPSAVQARVLGSIGRGGWNVTGVTDEVKSQSVVDPRTGQVTSQLAPTGNKIWAISGPGGKNDTVTVKPSDATPGDFDVVNPPANLSNTQVQAVKDQNGNAWYPDDPNNPSAGWHIIVPAGTPNADDEIKKAVDRQVAEGDRNARQRNEATYGIYADDATTQKLLNDARAQNLNQDQLTEKIREFNATQGETQRQFDIKQAAQDRVDAANILKTGAETTQLGATTAGTQATTQQTLQNIDIARQKLPGELAQQGATLAGTQANTAQALQATQIAAQPTIEGGLTTPYITQRNPLTGQVSQTQMNLAYQPKTQAEVAARVGQIQGLMNQKSAEVQAKVGQTIAGKQYTADDALKEFNDWYGQNVAPQADSLQAAQEEAAFQRGKDIAATRQAAMQTALGAGTQNVSAFNAMAGANPIGPNFEAANAAASKGDFGALAGVQGATTYQAPNPMDTARQATMDALKYIDPTAAAATGAPAPNLAQIDVGAALNPTRYIPGAQVGTPIAPPPAMAAPPPGAAPGGGAPSGYDWNGLMNRLGADQAAQRIQAGIQMPAWLTGAAPPPSQGATLANNPWLQSQYQFGG